MPVQNRARLEAAPLCRQRSGLPTRQPTRRPGRARLLRAPGGFQAALRQAARPQLRVRAPQALQLAPQGHAGEQEQRRVRQRGRGTGRPPLRCGQPPEAPAGPPHPQQGQTLEQPRQQPARVQLLMQKQQPLMASRCHRQRWRRQRQQEAASQRRRRLHPPRLPQTPQRAARAAPRESSRCAEQRRVRVSCGRASARAAAGAGAAALLALRSRGLRPRPARCASVPVWRT